MSKVHPWDKPFKVLIIGGDNFKEGSVFKDINYPNNSLYVVRVYKNTIIRKIFAFFHLVKPIPPGTKLLNVRNH